MTRACNGRYLSRAPLMRRSVLPTVEAPGEKEGERMDLQIVGFVFAIIGVITSVVWFLFLRRGVRELEKGIRRAAGHAR